MSANMVIDLANSTVKGGVDLYPAAQTTTTFGAGQDLHQADQPVQALLMVGAVSGTTPTLNGSFQESTDNTTWTAVADSAAAFTQVTTSNKSQRIKFWATKRYVRSTFTFTGTTPSFTMGVEIICQSSQTGTGGGSSISPQV